MKYIVLALIYSYVTFMAWSAFGWVGIAYVVIIPLPLFLFSWLARRNRKKNGPQTNVQLNLWSSPIPYLSVLFVTLIVFHVVN